MYAWYSELDPDEIAGKHVRATLDDGTVLEGHLVYDEDDGFVRLSRAQLFYYWNDGSESQIPCLTLLVDSEDECWHPLEGVKALELVWDEADWVQVGLDDIEAIDALVVAGRLYELVSHKPDCDLWQVRVPGEKHTARVSTAMISCALRRKVGAAEGHESSGPFESLVQYLMPKIPVSDGRAV